MALPQPHDTAQFAAFSPVPMGNQTQGMPYAVLAANQPAVAQESPFDVNAFLQNHQLHVQKGSLIDPKDPLLVVHRDDVRPENEPALRAKIHNAYTMDYPSLFSDSNKSPIIEKLASLVPLDIKTKEAVVARQMVDILEQQRTGVDPKAARALDDVSKPFAAVIREYHEDDKDLKLRPDVVEQAKNGIGLYLVLEEALRARGYKEEPYQLDERSQTADALLVRMGRHLGVDVPKIKESAALGGVDGVGRLLGVSDDYLSSVHRLTNHLADHHFSANATQSWKVGGMADGMQMAGVQERIDAGLRMREQAKLQELQQNPQSLGVDTPYVRDSEQLVLAAMRALPPALAESLYRIGTDVVYTPELTVDAVSPGMQAYGFHRRVTHNPDDVQGVQQIFVAGKHDMEEFKRVVVHEAHHLVFPNQFSEPLIQAVDGLTKADKERLGKLRDVMNAWHKGDEPTRQQAWQRLNSEEFAVNGKPLAQALGGASLDTFHNMVEHAHERLQIESDTYHKGGYSSPQSRFQEINSRYAELRYVRLKDNPEMLQFIVPNTTAIYEQIYMPHVEKQLQALRSRDAAKGQGAANDMSVMKPNVAVVGSGNAVGGNAAGAQLCCANGLCDLHQPQALSGAGRANAEPSRQVMSYGATTSPVFEGLGAHVMR